MKLHLNTASGQNAITGHGPGFVQVNQTRVNSALIVLPDRLLAPWEVANAGGLTVADFAVLIDLRPELVVFGSGSRFAFPDPAIMAAFARARIGFETMDTPAACRTYNVLAGEGRVVAAAMLL